MKIILFTFTLLTLIACNDSQISVISDGDIGTPTPTSSPPPPGPPFVSIWRTTAPGEVVTLPLPAGYNYSFTVDWGDLSPIDTVTSSFDVTRSHAYAIPGDYTITITGTAEAFKSKWQTCQMIEVVDLGDMGWKSLEGAFTNCSNLTSFAGGNTENVTSMAEMFSGLVNLTSLDLSSFDTSNVTSMKEMFQGASSLTTIDLSSFNTSNVTDMSYMFAGTSSLANVNLSSFNTSNVTNMQTMFGGSSIATLDLSSFNTTNVTNMGWIFFSTPNLVSLNTTNWDITAAAGSSSVFIFGNPGLIVTCNQGGTPGSGMFFGKACN